MIDVEFIKQIFKFGAVYTDRELQFNIEVCLSAIKDIEHDIGNPLLNKYNNALRILNKEVEKRWWNKLRVSETTTDEDIEYILTIVNIRNYWAKRLLGKDQDILNANEGVRQIHLSQADSMFRGFDLTLTSFKEIKGL